LNSNSPPRPRSPEDAAGKARYLLSIFATTPAAQDPRRQRLIADLLADFIRLSAKNE
jgi:hypothetical protein